MSTGLILLTCLAVGAAMHLVQFAALTWRANAPDANTLPRA